MKTYNRQSSIIATLLSLVLSIIGWVILAPAQLGGSVTYVIVDGNSMEPGFHLGDLLLIRTEPSYQIGDAVTYQNEELGRFVFHRIVGMELDRFILQGDNNAWLDSYHPNQDEIIGKLWVHIPKLGKAVEWVRQPINLEIAMSLLVGGVFMSSMITKSPQHGKEKNKPSQKIGGMKMKEGFLYFAGFLALFFLGLTIFLFTRPLTRATGNIPYQQEGYFFYSATGTPGVYDTDLVRSGEPVFPKLTCFLNIGFTYNLLADQLQAASGTYELYARVSDRQSGWQRTIPLNPQTVFSGNTYFSVATLDLCQVESMTNLVEQETGLHPNTYSLEIISHVELTGNIAGNQISDNFDPSLVFEFDKVHFYLDIKDAQTDPLHSIKQGLAGSSALQANIFPIFGLNLTVQSARLISLICLGFSLIGLIVMGIYVYKKAGDSQDMLIRLKYGAMLVDINEQNLNPASTVIDVTTIDDLARLAERHGTMILHMQLNLLHYYLVQSNEITYRFVTSNGEETADVKPVYNEVQAPMAHFEEKQDFDAGPSHDKTLEDMVDKDDNKTVNIQPARNITTEHMLGNDTVKLESVQNKIVQQTISQEEKTSFKVDVLEQLVNSHKDKAVDVKPVYEDTLEYVIDTGEIGFVMPVSEETKILRKIKL